MPAHPSRILVAEDEHLVATDLVMHLRDAGYKVVGPAPDGEAALEFARSADPDLALLDVRMPKRDGLSIAGEIYEELGIPAIILSAFSDDEYVRMAQQAGVFGYLVKPATGGQLRACIEVAWGAYVRACQSSKVNADLRRKLEERRIVERAKWILVQRKGLSEADAMHALQRHARSTRRKIVEVAQQLLDANELI
ncbi:MAG: response regulator [Phycisphaerales bacterium]|nr:response regulator [Phycisphaerales bacterium]